MKRSQKPESLEAIPPYTINYYTLLVSSVDIFFALLRSGMYGTPIPSAELPTLIDWKEIIAIARKQVVLGIIIDSIQWLPENLRPSPKLTAKLNKFALGLIQANLVIEKTIGRLSSFLQQHGIDGVLLKGQGTARYYRQPQMRHSGDIDFYVGKAAYKEASALCREYLRDNNSNCSNNEHHFNFNMDGVPVELHHQASTIYTPARNKRFQQWTAEQLLHSPERRVMTLGNAEVKLPSYDFDAIFIFYHAWRHFIMGGIGIRQLCDWVLIFHTHGDDIDKEQLIENIHRFGITEGWKLFACIAVRYLGASPDKIPLYDPAYHKKSEKIFEEIMEGGNFGYHSAAHLRTKGYRQSGLHYGLLKVGNITRYFLSLFPLIPLEATFLYLNRLYHGTIDTLRRSKK